MLLEEGPWLGSTGVKTICSSLGSTQSLVASEVSQSPRLEAWGSPKVARLGSQAGETPPCQGHPGTCPSDPPIRGMRGLQPGPTLLVPFQVIWPVLCPPNGLCQPTAREGSGLSNGPRGRALSPRPAGFITLYNLLMRPPSAGLGPTPQAWVDQGCQQQPAAASSHLVVCPTASLDGQGTCFGQLGSPEGIRAALRQGIFQTTA